MEIELLTFGFGGLMDLYQSFYFELFPCIIYIYIRENVFMTPYFKYFYVHCVLKAIQQLIYDFHIIILCKNTQSCINSEIEFLLALYGW